MPHIETDRHDNADRPPDIWVMVLVSFMSGSEKQNSTAHHNQENEPDHIYSMMLTDKVYKIEVKNHKMALLLLYVTIRIL